MPTIFSNLLGWIPRFAVCVVLAAPACLPTYGGIENGGSLTVTVNRHLETNVLGEFYEVTINWHYIFQSTIDNGATGIFAPGFRTGTFDPLRAPLYTVNPLDTWTGANSSKVISIHNSTGTDLNGVAMLPGQSVTGRQRVDMSGTTRTKLNRYGDINGVKTQLDFLYLTIESFDLGYMLNRTAPTNGGLVAYARISWLGTPITYTVTPSAGPNGSLSPSTTQTVSSGGSVSFTATPATGYAVDQWRLDGSLVQNGISTYTVSNVTANKTVSVTFKRATFSVQPIAGLHGSISPNTVQTVNAGGTVSFTASPSTGYMVDQWWVDTSVAQTGSNTFTLSPVTADRIVQVTFRPVATHTVTPGAGSNGSISPNTVQTVISGGSVTFTASSNSGFAVNQWLVNGSIVQAGGTSYTVSNVTSNKTVQVTFVAGYTVTPSAGPNGSISPNTAQIVSSGSSVGFTGIPNGGYAVSQWLLNGSVVQTGSNSYTVSNVTSNKTVQVTFIQTAVLAADIVVEQPAGNSLVDNSATPVTFPAVNVGSSTDLTFTIKNIGGTDLTGLTITKDGTNQSEFTITQSPTAPVSGPSGSTTLVVRFAPTAAGTRTATLHIASNDTDENPFDIRLSGLSVHTDPSALSEITVGNTATRENLGAAYVPITITPAASSAVVLRVEAIEGSADLGADYFTPARTLTIPAGSTFIELRLGIHGNRHREKTETFTVRIEVESGPATVLDDSATVTIFDDERRRDRVPVVVHAPRSQTKAPGEPVTFTASASGASRYQWLRDGLPVPGATSRVLSLASVTAGDDGARFSLRVENRYGGTTSAEAVLRVSSTAPASMVSFTAASREVNEDVGTALVQVHIEPPLGSEVTVTFAVQNGGTTVPGSDFAEIGSATIAAGAPNGSGTIRIIDDTQIESDESFTLQASSPGLTVQPNTQTWTIHDNDRPRAGESWHPVTSPTIDDLESVAYANGRFVAVGANGRIVTSTDGLSWTTATSGTTARLLGATPANGGDFYAVGTGGTLLYSSNGTSWSQRSLGTSADLSGFAYDARMTPPFVLVGANGLIRTSTDGVTWTSRTSNTTASLNWVSAAGATWCAVGNGGTIRTCADASGGATWVARTSNTTGNLSAVLGNQIATGTGGALITSDDSGLTWTARNSGTSAWIGGLARTDSLFIAVADQAVILTSPDRINWTRRESNTNNWLSGVAYDPINGVAIAVGGSGTILASP